MLCNDLLQTVLLSLHLGYLFGSRHDIITYDIESIGAGFLIYII